MRKLQVAGRKQRCQPRVDRKAREPHACAHQLGAALVDVDAELDVAGRHARTRQRVALAVPGRAEARHLRAACTA